jgi:hypothetical protein
VTLISITVAALTIPSIMTSLHLAFPTKWATATRNVVQMAFGSWIGTVVMSIARILVWSNNFGGICR